MTQVPDLDDALRRALHAAVDPLIPAGDGLLVIRHRNAHPSTRDHIARVFAALTALRIRLCKEITHG